MEEVNRSKRILANLGLRCSEGAQLYHERSGSAGICFCDPDGIRIELCAIPRVRRLRKDLSVNSKTGIPSIQEEESTSIRATIGNLFSRSLL